MLPNEVFALACRERYAEDGLVVDESNGEFAHCPLPKSMGDSGYYLLHDDHQWQGLLQSKDVGRMCYWIPDVKRWLMKANFVEGYFELWDIYDEFNGGVHHPNKGKPHSEETRRRMSKARKGVPLSEEHKRKLSEVQKGVPRKPLSEETRRRMSEAHKGVPRKPLSEEHKRKLREASKGVPRKPHSEESRRRMSEARKGVPKSEETRRRMSQAHCCGGFVKAILVTKPCGSEIRYESITEAQRELGANNNIFKFIKTSKIVTRGKFKGWKFRYA